MIEDTIQTLDTIRAAQASEFIRKIKGKKDAGEIRTEIEALPARIRVNGLLQTLVFLLEKDDEKQDRAALGKALVNHLAGSAVEDYSARAISICKNRLRQATEEAFAYAGWLKLMAKAEIKKNKKPGRKSHE